MNQYLNGPSVPFRTKADRKALVGKMIKYLRRCDIDRSGRGYFFPRVDFVEREIGRELIFSNGNTVLAGDLVEIEVLG